MIFGGSNCCSNTASWGKKGSRHLICSTNSFCAEGLVYIFRCIHFDEASNRSQLNVCNQYGLFNLQELNERLVLSSRVPGKCRWCFSECCAEAVAESNGPKTLRIWPVERTETLTYSFSWSIDFTDFSRNGHGPTVFTQVFGCHFFKTTRRSLDHWFRHLLLVAWMVENACPSDWKVWPFSYLSLIPILPIPGQKLAFQPSTQCCKLNDFPTSGLSKNSSQ